MKGIHHFLQTALLLLYFSSISAQTPDTPLAEMTWQGLTEKWESLAIKGKNAEALPYARAALEIARRDSSEASLDYGNSLDYLGYSLHHTGQYAEAEQVFQAAVEHARLHLGEDHEDYITRLSNLAMLHMDMDKLAQAASELESAVHLAKINLSEDNEYVPIMLNNLGLAYENMGNFDRALEYYLNALDLTERTLGKDNVRYANRLFNIAAIYRKTGKREKALDFNLRALPIYEKLVGKKHPDYINGLAGLMVSYTELGRFKEALPISDSLLALMKENVIQETKEEYNFKSSVANLYFRAGQYKRCAEFSQTALKQYREIFPRQYSNHAYLASLIMASLEKMGQIEESKTFALLHSHFSLDELRGGFSNFSEAEQLRFYQTYRQRADVASLLFATRHPEFPDLSAAAYNYQLTVKGLSLANRRALFQSLRQNPDARLAAQFEEWQKLQIEVSRQYALTPSRREANLDSLLTRANALERNLVLGSEPFRLTNQNARWQDVQAALSPGEAGIEFGQIKNPDADSILYMAWLIRPGDETPKQVFLFEEKEIGNLAATRRLYTLDHSFEGKNLHELLWKPLEPYLEGVSTLYFAPAGVIHQVNLGAVPVSASEVIADRLQLHRLVSTRQVITLKKTAGRTTPKSALVFGGIRYETDSLALAATNLLSSEKPLAAPTSQSRGAAFGEEWDFLGGTLKEATEVRNRLEKAGTKVIFADGFHASEGFFKKNVLTSRSPEVLHLATHGFFLTVPDTNARNGFATAGNPMARAGLILSGANRTWSSGEPLAGQEDGILTALEISRLDLSGTELAVLSACGTGQGKVEAGEGVLGLQRAFKMAGAHYVLMTLWNVQDQDAQQFMAFFYDEWLGQKKSIPDAFRVAQRKMRLLHSKPFQPMAWAGFLLLE